MATPHSPWRTPPVTKGPSPTTSAWSRATPPSSTPRSSATGAVSFPGEDRLRRGERSRRPATTRCCSTPGCRRRPTPTATRTTPARAGGEFIGPGSPVDTDRFFVICSNLIGGCYGCAGPASTDPVTRTALGYGLPDRDRRRHGARAAPAARPPGHRAAARGVGASLGGMQSLLLAALVPERMGRSPLLGRAAFASPGDRPALRAAAGGDGRRRLAQRSLYGTDFPHRGQKLAREIGTITYRSGPAVAGALRAPAQRRERACRASTTTSRWSAT